MMIDILGISGSPRRGGNSESLLKTMLEGAEQAGAVTDAVFLREVTFSSCVGCERCRKDKICTKFVDGMTLLYPKILEAKGLVLISPAHNYNVTALMKAFIDRMYCFYDFANTRPRDWSSRLAGQGRKAVVAGVCEQEDTASMGVTIDMQRVPITALGYDVIDQLAVYSIFDAGAVKKHPDIMGRARMMGAGLARAVLEK
ncbi:MAG: flavodoxin family protein [Desulfoplanes sp.]|jgi:multimeric flavodoxin WrbA